MSDDPAGAAHRSPANPDLPDDPTVWDPEVEVLDEAECLGLIPAGGVGRLAYSTAFGPVVIPVGYRLVDSSIVFRTVLDSPTDEDLRTGIQGADYKGQLRGRGHRPGGANRLVRACSGPRAPCGLR